MTDRRTQPASVPVTNLAQVVRVLQLPRLEAVQANVQEQQDVAVLH